MRFFDWIHGVDLREEIQEIYLHRFLFELALGTVTIFLPLYLWNLGFSIPQIFLFFAVYYGVFIILSWPVAHITARVGYKHTAFVSSPFILGFYLLLRSLDAATPTVYAAGLLGGIGFITYWIGMNAEMARSSHDGKREEETGYFFSMPLIAAVIAPFIGGMIIETFGFSVLFLLAAFTILSSYTPFLLSREHSSGMDLSPSAIFNRDHITDFAVFMADGAVNMGTHVLWPLYLAIVVTGALNIGGAGSMTALGGALISIFLGHRVTEETRGRTMLIGGITTAATWIIMAFVTTPLQAFAIAFLNGLLFYVVSLPLYSEALEHAEHEDIIEYFAFREIALCSGRILMLGIFTALYLALSEQRMFLLGFTALTIASLAMGILGRRLTRV